MPKTKKTVLFIVEGSSDKVALEKIFKEIYKANKNIIYKYTRGDITSDENITESNVCDKIYKILKEYMDDRKLTKKNIWQIVLITDMDGAYVPESALKEGKTKEFVYSSTSIECNNIDKIKVRNERKSKLIDFLLKINEINAIPFEMYYMSSNLDHALYNEQNLNDDRKQLYSDAFHETFEGKEYLFINFLYSDVVNGVPDCYPKSWSYIKSGLHSLERHTNLHIYFIKNPVLE